MTVLQNGCSVLGTGVNAIFITVDTFSTEQINIGRKATRKDLEQLQRVILQAKILGKREIRQRIKNSLGL